MFGVTVFEAIKVKGRSEMITNFRGHNLKIQHWTSFDLNGIKIYGNILKIAANQCISPNIDEMYEL